VLPLFFFFYHDCVTASREVLRVFLLQGEEVPDTE
jgi:hypothetical protein